MLLLKKIKSILLLPTPLYLVLLIVLYSVSLLLIIGKPNENETPDKQALKLEKMVFSENGVEIPIKWGNLGPSLVELGVIDKKTFLELYKSGPLSSATSNYEQILSENYNKNIKITQENSGFVLNILWALGLAQESLVLQDMEMQYPEIGNLAATGGWTISNGDAMSHYGAHSLLTLSAEQQVLVKEIAQNIYRPCCNNSTAFADCNHGMAMLGLIELMVSQGFSKEEIYNKALAVNTMWFPDTYLTIAKYLVENENTSWENIDAKKILGREFSSASGFANVRSQVEPLPNSGSGGSCSV